MSTMHPVTAEAFFAMPEPPGKWLELVAGEVVETRPAGALQGLVTAKLATRLHEFVQEWDLGRVFYDGVGYLLHRNPDTVRLPDASFVAWSETPDRVVPEWFWTVPPAIAVEYIVPEDLANDVQARKCDYLDAGGREVWLLWSTSRSISRWRADRTSQELGPDDTLEGGGLLPGFQVKVADLFDVE